MGKTYLAVVVGAIMAGAFAVSAHAADVGLTIDNIQFVDHLKAGMIEQDVFVQKTPGSGKVYRVTNAEKEKYLGQPVFAAANPVHHAPFNPKLNGPHPKGRALGITLGDWLSASGAAKYACSKGQGKLSASFTNLVPNGVYTMWIAYAAKPHMGCVDCAFATLDMPIGAADGSQSPFTADSKGVAKYEASFKPCLQLGRGLIAAMLAIAYHSDGATYGPQPGKMGSVAHVQLFSGLPDAGAQ